MWLNLTYCLKIMSSYRHSNWHLTRQHSSSSSPIPHLYLHSPTISLSSQWPQYLKQLQNHNANSTSNKESIKIYLEFYPQNTVTKSTQSAQKYGAESSLNSFSCMWGCYAFSTHLEPLDFVLHQLQTSCFYLFLDLISFYC